MGSPEHTSNREAADASRQPQIRSAPGVALSAPQIELLARVVGDSGSVFVKREFRSGYSGAVVMLVSTGAGEAPVVVKFAHPIDLQQEYHAYQRYVVRASPQNIAHLRGEPLVTSDGQLGLLQYTFAGGESHQPTTSLLDYYTASGGEATAAVLNRIFRIYGRHWWGNNRPEVYTLGEQYDRLLPVHLQVADSRRDDDIAHTLITANHTSVTELRTLRLGQRVRLLGFDVVKVRDNGRTMTLWSEPPSGEATAPLRIRLESEAERNCRPGETLECVDAVVVATRTDLLADAARSAMPQFVAEEEAFTAHLPDEAGQLQADALINPIYNLSACLDRVVETKMSTIHGDINLQNVLVDPQTGFSWLIDFGETRPGPTLLDLQRLEVQVITKLLPDAAAQAELEAASLVDLMASLHADPLPTFCLHPGLWEPFAVLLTVRRLARHYLMDDLHWDEYYYGLTIALVGALKFDELTPFARALALVGAATALRLVGEPVITASVRKPGVSGTTQTAQVAVRRP